MNLLTGFLFVLIAGFFQGSFVLPMTLTKNWQWEHTWATFSLLGMLIFNWLIALLIIPDIWSIYKAVPATDLIVLILFGAGWGIGAILFGLGMERLGMALGYPIIMGLIASLGALIPLVIFFPATLMALRGMVLLAGTAIVILGIVLCTIAGSRKHAATTAGTALKVGVSSAGLAIAIFAGILSCFPNVGMAFASSLVRAAEAAGTPAHFAGNAVWALFFTVGFLVNFSYCLFLMARHRNFAGFANAHLLQNIGWGALMALMWIGSFYLYGIGASRLGKLGIVAGWPLYISLSIGFGNLWGLWRGEWKGAQSSARALLNLGLLVLLLAIITIAVSNTL
ncbi:MAG TPA: L-rhamnose/proton symporter RhaT [bacterium]|mgnify:CR=1 FL=1|nr:L-rhamnose/proton symporter RhaT [bacterium]HPR88470.1 L-rhamnose/proton symporter RhaT [bacterium]